MCGSEETCPRRASARTSSANKCSHFHRQPGRPAPDLTASVPTVHPHTLLTNGATITLSFGIDTSTSSENPGATQSGYDFPIVAASINVGGVTQNLSVATINNSLSGNLIVVDNNYASPYESGGIVYPYNQYQTGQSITDYSPAQTSGFALYDSVVSFTPLSLYPNTALGNPLLAPGQNGQTSDFEVYFESGTGGPYDSVEAQITSVPLPAVPWLLLSGWVGLACSPANALLSGYATSFISPLFALAAPTTRLPLPVCGW
jgi:hypothetical protein